MPNPYLLLGFVLVLAISNIWTHFFTLDVAADRQAARDLEVANAYYETARRNATFESAEALRKAKAAAEARRRAEATDHQLELELVKDEAARTCRVSDGTFGVLIDAIRSANGAISKGKANSSDGSVPAPARTDRPNLGLDSPMGKANGEPVR